MASAGVAAPLAISLAAVGFSPFFGWWRYWAIVAWVAWCSTFVLRSLFAPHLRLPQTLGLLAVVLPFARFLYGIVRSFESLNDPTTVAPALTVAAMWEVIWQRPVLNVVAPLSGLAVVLGPRLASLRGGAARREALLDGAGLDRKKGWAEQLYAGLALFLPVLLLYIYGTEFIAAGVGRGLDTGDDSQVFVLVTPALSLLLALVAGLTEEFLFRGVLLRALRPQVGLHLAVAMQAVFFGFIHAGYGSWLHVLGPMALGWGLGYVAARWGLVATILIHAGLDFVIFGANAIEGGYSLMLWPVLIFLALCLVLPVWHYRRRLFGHLYAGARAKRPPSAYKGF